MRSFHQGNSAIAEGLVLLRDGILESSERAVLCFWWQPSGEQNFNHSASKFFGSTVTDQFV